MSNSGISDNRPASTDSTARQRGWLAQSWQDTPAKLQWAAVASVAFGVSLLVVGLVIDQLDGWRDWPYILNMYSSATAACIGIPFALIVLQGIVRRQADLARRREISDLKSTVAYQLYHSTVAIIDPRGAGQLDERVLPCAQTISEAAARITTKIAVPYMKGEFNSEEVFDPLDAERVAELVHSFQSDADTFAQAADDLNRARLPSSSEVAKQMTSAAAEKWHFLDQYVKPRVLAAGGAWLDNATVEQLNSTFFDCDNLLGDTIDLRDHLVPRYRAGLQAARDGHYENLYDFPTDLVKGDFRRQVEGVAREVATLQRLLLVIEDMRRQLDYRL